MTEVQLPGGRPNDPVFLAAADGSIWAAASGLLHRIDAATGEARLTGRVDQSPYQIGLDADGLWVSRPFGMTLVDPESGEMLRRIESREDEGEGHPYRTIMHPPSFGSVWDYDRSAGAVHRIDPVSGQTSDTIEITEDVVHERCGDPRPLVGLDGMQDLVAARCGTAQVLIDPATNTVLHTVPTGQGQDIVIDGAWWWLRIPDDATWDAPGSLVRVDPRTGAVVDVLTFTSDRTAGFSPVVVGDALWLVVSERAESNQAYDNEPRLVRVPLDRLLDSGQPTP